MRTSAPGEAWERGKRCNRDLGNLSTEPSGYPVPPGRGWPPAGTECCVVAERSALRSVHRECAGRVIEPREIIPASADVVSSTEGRIDTPSRAWREELAGVRERGMRTWGLPRNLGDLIVSARESRDGRPVKQPRPGGGALGVPGSEDRARARYRQAKETKRGGRGGQATEHFVVPGKRGNPPQGTPRREGGAGSWNRGRER